tara:strand:+ start:270 stop:581 length:312 start_codon:yes stop_codon:yes gene_type:complete
MVMSRANFSKMTRSAPAKGAKMEKKLKPIPPGKKGKGLRQLPKIVRNKMNFMSKGRMTKRQKDTLERHSVHHTKAHMDLMKKEMRAGKTFGQAHKKAMKKVGK